METQRTELRMPLYIRDEIKLRTTNLSKWIIEACREKIEKEKREYLQNNK